MLLWWLICLLVACQTDPYPAPVAGTAYRIGKDVPGKDSEVQIDLLTTWQECAGAQVDDMEACLPRMDRASGEVQLAFTVRDPQTSTQLYRSISQDQLKITHDKSTQSGVELVPHEPVSSGQLFIVLIDGSGSMYEDDQARIKKVYTAMMMPSVVEGFFPAANAKTGVVLMRFSDALRGLDGGPPRVITDPEDYRAMVKDHLLKPSGGYTHMYDAVQESVTTLLEADAVRTFLQVKGAEPTIVVLTDGFNNEEAADTCATNAPRLQKTLDTLRDVRTNVGVSARPRVFTVGLGQALAGVEKPKGRNVEVTPYGLCGKYADYPIDNGLENYGIDHVSLQWMAEVGGGVAFVKRKPRGLADVFKAAAAARYRWFEARYRVPDSLYHRKSFEVEVQLNSADLAFTRVKVYPSAWVDAPSGVRPEGENWTAPRPFVLSLTILMPTGGLLILLYFMGPAWFNARRAITRRARTRRK